MRVSVTDVDCYRRYKSSEDMPLEDLLAQLRRELPQTSQMAAGAALHKILEESEPDYLIEAEADGIKFKFNLTEDLALPDVRELKLTSDYKIGGHLVTLVGKVDAISGPRVFDHKLTGKFDAERYVDSFQWRAYLTLAQARRFTYNVFTGEPDPEGVWNIWGLDSLDLYRYPMMEGDVLLLLDEYVDFVKKFLPEKLT